jgi:hypothetical protein
MKEIIINENMKPCIVYAKAMGGMYSDWLVFISKVEKENYRSYPHIKHFICMTVGKDKDEVYFHEDGEVGWGYANNLNWNFYIPSEKQKQTLIKEMANMGYKYVSVLDKLVKKT